MHEGVKFSCDQCYKQLRWLENCELVEKRKKEARNNENEDEKETRRQETKERITFLRDGRSEENIKKDSILKSSRRKNSILLQDEVEK